jgi:hypothetical protein
MSATRNRVNRRTSKRRTAGLQQPDPPSERFLLLFIQREPPVMKLIRELHFPTTHNHILTITIRLCNEIFSSGQRVEVVKHVALGDVPGIEQVSPTLRTVVALATATELDIHLVALLPQHQSDTWEWHSDLAPLVMVLARWIRGVVATPEHD